jgi:hypothetical protein
MKKILLLLLFTCFLLDGVYAQEAQGTWGINITTANAEAGTKVAFSPSGDMFLAGTHSGAGVSFSSNIVGYGGGTDYCVARYSNTGTFKGARASGCSGNEAIRDMVVDASHNIYLVGSSTSTCGGVYAGGTDIFIHKFNGLPNVSTYSFTKQIGGTGDDAATAMVLRGSELVVTGYFAGTINLGGGNITSAGDSDMFVARYDTLTGNHIGSFRIGGAGKERPYDIELDASGNIYLTGQFSTSGNFDGVNTITVATTSVFTAKYTSTGTLTWLKTFSPSDAAPDISGGFSLSLDSGNNLYISGNTYGNVDYGQGLVTGSSSRKPFLLKYDNNGNFQWVKHIYAATASGAGETRIEQGSGDVIWGMSANGAVNFGSGAMPNNNGIDTYLVRYKADGTLVNVLTYIDQTSTDVIGGIALRGGELLLAGSTSSGNQNGYFNKYNIPTQNQTITFPTLNASYPVTAPNFNVNATASSGKACAYASSNTTIATISPTGVVDVKNVGTTTITIIQSGGGLFYAAPPVSQVLTVSKGDQFPLVESPTPKNVGDAPFFLATSSGGGTAPVVLSTANTNVITLSAATGGYNVTIVGAGTATITVTQAGDANYNASTPFNVTQVVNGTPTNLSLFPLPTKTFGDAPFQITTAYYSTNNNLSPVTFTSSNTSVATISGSTVTIVGAGTTTINAQQTGNSTFNPATSNAQTLTVNKAFQNINFPVLPTKTFGDAPFTISATGGASGNPIVFTSSDNGIASISGNTVTIHTAGAVTIFANQAGNSNYLASSTYSQPLTINKLNQTVNFTNSGDVQYGDAPFALIATGGATNNPITFSSSNSSIISISGSTATIVGVGTCNITASQAGNVNYNAGSATKLFSVIKGSQNIVMSPIPPKSFGDAPFTVSATGGASGNPIVFSSNNASVATVSGNTVTIVGGGVCNITAIQAGNALYFQGIATQQLTVGKINQTITFNALPAKTFGDAPFALSASASSSLPVSYASSNTSVATVSGNTITIVGVGTANITASQAGNANYNSATNVAQTLTVGKANQTITFNALPTKTFGDAPFALSASASSSLPVSYASSNTSVATISGNTITIVGVGTANIIASQAGNANYNVATDVTQTLTVGKANQTITFNALPAKTFGDAPFALSASASSSLPVSYASSNTSVATISGNTITIVGVGTANITASQAGNANYNLATDVTQTLTVGKANQIITFPAIADKVYGESPFALNATTSSGLAVSYNITTNPTTGVATLSGNTITIVGLGSVSVTASQTGNVSYNSATDVIRTFNIVYPTSALPTVSISEISIYPNPSKSGIFEVSGLQSVDKQQVSYQVIDASGKAVLRGVWAGKDRETLNLQKAVSGNYTLVLQGSKAQTSKKIIKQ